MRRKTVALSAVSLLAIVGVALAANAGHRGKSAPKILLGNSQVGHRSAHERAGSAQIFGFKGRKAGTATSIRVYVGSHNRATKLIVGIYGYRNGSASRRLAVGTLSKPDRGRWNSLKIRHVRIRSGRHYGISVLARGGVLYFRDRSRAACHGATSDAIRANALPARWHGGKRRASCAISAYVVGTPRHRGNNNAAKGGKGGGGSPGSGPPGSGSGGNGAGPPGVVGTAGAPTPNCSTVVAPGNDPTSALSNAAAGATVCLADGNWPRPITIGQTLSTAVTLAAQHPGQTTVHGINVPHPLSNLTVEGLKMSEGFQLLNSLNNDTFNYNTMEGWGGSDAQTDSAVYSYAQASGSSNSTANNVTIEFNQMDHVPQCLAVNSTGATPSGWTFNHNVCGPGIGYNGSQGPHYIQGECINDFTMDHNAFEGPFDSTDEANPDANHINVVHACGTNVTFDNNIMWHVQAVAQAVLIGDDGPTNGFKAEDNLYVADPTCASQSGSSCTSLAFWQDKDGTATNDLFANNTIESDIRPQGGNAGGIQVISGVTNLTATNNLAATGGKFGDYAFDSPCSCSGNVSADGTGNIKNWKPVWQSTNWTPNNGTPYKPPPANYYEPATLGSTVGYRGTVGP